MFQFGVELHKSKHSGEADMLWVSTKKRGQDLGVLVTKLMMWLQSSDVNASKCGALERTGTETPAITLFIIFWFVRLFSPYINQLRVSKSAASERTSELLRRWAVKWRIVILVLTFLLWRISSKRLFAAIVITERIFVVFKAESHSSVCFLSSPGVLE